jgi:hypothetical protein
MSSRTICFGAAIRRGEPLRVAVGVLVLAGLAASVLVNIWIDLPEGVDLPGVALGSPALLVVERAMAFFAAWLLMLVVVAQAFRGRLPTEISGRGVRYADAEAVRGATMDTEAALHVVRRDITDLRDAMFVLEGERKAERT